MFEKIKGYDPSSHKNSDESVVTNWMDDLSSADDANRARAAFMLAMLPEHPEKLSSLLIKLIKKEKNEDTKAGALLALGAVNGRNRDYDNVELMEKLTGCNSESPRTPPLPVRIAAIISLAWTRPAWISQEMIDLLKTNISLKKDPKALPWNNGNLGEISEFILPGLVNIDAGDLLGEIEDLLKAHPRKKNGGWSVEVNWPWQRLVERVFAPFKSREEDTPVLSELSEGQVRVLLFGIKNKLNLRMLRSHGFDFVMPKWDWSRPSWRRYLNLEKPGMLDYELRHKLSGELKQYPLWKWFRLLSAGEVDTESLKSSVRKALSDKEIIELGRDATTMIYATFYEGDDDPSPRSSLICELIDSLDEKSKGSDVEIIRNTLEIIAEEEMYTMENKGWKGGPFKPRAKKKKAKD